MRVCRQTRALSMSVSSLVALAAAGAPAQVFAQDGGAVAESEEGRVSTIVVTATKRGQATDVQDVNASITALGQEQLSDAVFSDLASLTYNVPNVQLDEVGTTPGFQNFSFRGLGINSSIVTVEPTVGVFVDGVYQGINAGQVFDTFDLEGLEILRGPQGVLFGRNVTGGAVLLNTGKPSFNTRITGGLSVETGLNYTGDLVVTGPIVDDVVAAKLAVYVNYDEGYFTNLADNSEFGESFQFIVRPALTFRLSDTTELTIRAEHGEIDGDDSGVAAQNHALFSRNSFDFNVDETGFNEADWTSVTGELNIDVAFGDGTITNIAGWRKYRQDTLLDVDGTLGLGFNSQQYTSQEQFSDELRYAGTFGVFDLTVGAFYFTQDIFHIEERNLASANGPVTLAGGGDYDHEQWAIFGNSDVHLSEQLTLNVGLRYSDENKSLHGSVYRPGGCDIVARTCTFTFPEDPSTFPANGGPASDSWNSLSTKIGLQYQPTDETLLYGYWARSFRSGGYNIRQARAATNPGPFDQEQQDTFEIGYKQDFADRRGRINVAGFFNKLDGIQREVNLPSPLGVAQDIVNAGDLEIYGVEVEAQFNVTNNFLLSAQFGYTHGEYTRLDFDISNDGVIDDNDLALQPPRLSPYTYGVSARYEADLGGGELVASASFNHRDGSFYDDRNAGFLNSFDSLTARLSYTPHSIPVTFAVYGKNLLDETAYGGDTQLPDVPPFGGDGAGPLPSPTFSPLAKGRVIGGSVRFEF